MLQENEIIITANAVKYHDIEYHDNYIVVTQNRTRRRVYNGYYFEDTGTHIYISSGLAHIFQAKSKQRSFIVNTETKEWREFETTIVEKHYAKKVKPIKNNIINELIKEPTTSL